eukprot:1345730-Amphidinium_carterae.1
MFHVANCFRSTPVATVLSAGVVSAAHWRWTGAGAPSTHPYVIGSASAIPTTDGTCKNMGSVARAE